MPRRTDDQVIRQFLPFVFFSFECGIATLDPPKEFSKEQTVILLFDPEGVASYSPGFVRTLEHSATEIGPEHMTVTVTYGCPLGA